jgi:hypothetical protein
VQQKDYVNMGIREIYWEQEEWMEPVLDRLVLNVLTGASVSVGEAKVVDSIQSQQVVEKLLLLILTAEECVALVLAPATAAKLSSLGYIPREPQCAVD